MMSNVVENFWERFLNANPHIDRSTPYQVWHFSDNSEAARELAELVLIGKKAATASLKTVNEIEPEKAPITDGYSVVTSFEGEPLLVLQTKEIRHIPFDEVEAQFASDEGEGDQTLNYWRQVHWDYFFREAPKYGLEFNERSIICCERFRLLFPVSSKVRSPTE